MKNILIVEDHADIAQLITIHLQDIQCQVTHASDGQQGLHYLQQQRFDLVILDLMLPGIDGLSLCQHIRRMENYMPILMLTSRCSELDRVLGLEVGADDYVTKPFSIRELMARIKALFRRVEAMQQPPDKLQQNTLQFGDLCMDLLKHRVTVDDRDIDLTAKEFELLSQFIHHPGRVYSRSQLLDTVWGYGHDGYEHTVNSHINRLRRKLEKDPNTPEYILTVWGVGYKFNDTLSRQH